MDTAVSREIIEIPLEEIIPNRFQPRLTFDMEALNDLARSIKEHGIIQPLVVRKIQDKYEIIAGERRFKAASMIGMKKVPCIVMELSDGESAEVAIVENIQRKEMTPLEEARSFKKLLDKGYITQEDLGKKMGKSQSSIANKLRLLNLDEVVQDAILNNRISERHARSILRISSKEIQREILNEIISKRLTVKQTDDLISNKYGNDSKQENFTNDSINNLDSPKKSTYTSLPEVKLPTYGQNNENSNPQLRLLNSLGSNKDQNPSYVELATERANELPDENTNPALDIFRYNNKSEPVSLEKEEEVEKPMNENMMDPSKLQPASSLYSRPDNVQEIKQEDSFVNLDQIKSEAQDIIPEEKPTPNMEELLHNENPERENKFFVGLEKPIQEENSFEDSDKDMLGEEKIKLELPIETAQKDQEISLSEEISNPEVSIPEQKVLPSEEQNILEMDNTSLNPEEKIELPEDKEEVIDMFDVEDKNIDYAKAKEELGKTIISLKEKGLKIYKEEADFGNTLQIIIRIDK